MPSRRAVIGVVLAATLAVAVVAAAAWSDKLGGAARGPGGGRALLAPPSPVDTPLPTPTQQPVPRPSPEPASPPAISPAPEPASPPEPAPPAFEQEEPTPVVASAGAQAPADSALPPPPTPTPVPLPPPGNSPPAAAGAHWDRTYAAQVLAGINARRTAAALPPLATEARLTTAAEGYARQMLDTGWYDHTGPDGRTFVQRIVDAGFPFTVPFGEVLAWSSAYVPPATIVDAWMNSPSHRQQILSPLYGLAGVGCYFAADNGPLRCAADLAGE